MMTEEELKKWRRAVLNKAFADIPYVETLVQKLEDDLSKFFEGKEYLNNADELKEAVDIALDCIRSINSNLSIMHHSLGEAPA